MKIGNLKPKGWVLSAPLAGISNRPFRVMAIANGAALVYTEMVSSEGIIRCQAKTLDIMRFGNDERPIGIQLFGANPESMKLAAQITARDFNPDLIDINLGCPVRKVVNKNGGAAALKDLVLTQEIIGAVVEGAGDIPVTIKMRTGWDDNTPVFLQVGDIAEKVGVDAVTLHARSRSKGFSGMADWGAIRELKQQLCIPVIGNGDVVTPDDARRMLDETSCDAVMVGRAALGNPMIYRQMSEFIENGVEQPEVSVVERIAMARQHAGLLVEEYGEARGIKKMRKYLGWYVRGFAGAAILRPRLFKVESIADIDAVFGEYMHH